MYKVVLQSREGEKECRMNRVKKIAQILKCRVQKNCNYQIDNCGKKYIYVALIFALHVKYSFNRINNCETLFFHSILFSITGCIATNILCY